jgi:sulfur carrier protein
VIHVNGEPTLIADDATVADLLHGLSVDREARGLAVAVDGEVVPRGAWDAYALRAGARVEIVAAVQGG